ncbi:hypothetical protein CROQUDRAFT_86500 [Cronartium quercuum f. sp. fusiforme G11]|uniref:Uncharacterized protein n=1 Tax=Cronartium quercuum f. sp. fusiforme G11 TaxID=708437 RepID=A0A9P6TII8_9BASI|nr:hypothetical protein CROQUDRAFT_86500 [Cronartium quercuum f. sp. fusiforme G11]
MACKMHVNLSHFTWRPQDLFDDFQNELVAAFNEFVGTVVFLLAGLGGIQAAAMSN